MTVQEYFELYMQPTMREEAIKNTSTRHRIRQVTTLASAIYCIDWGKPTKFDWPKLYKHCGIQAEKQIWQDEFLNTQDKWVLVANAKDKVKIGMEVKVAGRFPIPKNLWNKKGRITGIKAKSAFYVQFSNGKVQGFYGDELYVCLEENLLTKSNTKSNGKIQAVPGDTPPVRKPKVPGRSSLGRSRQVQRPARQVRRYKAGDLKQKKSTYKRIPKREL